MSDVVSPRALVADIAAASVSKVALDRRDMLLRGALSGLILGIATSLVFAATAQGLPPLVGAIIFPVGFVMLVLVGLELVTGNFAVLPAGMLIGRVGPRAVLRAWGWVYAGNLVGSLLYAALWSLVVTGFGTGDGGAVAELARKAAVAKTLAYADLGGPGMATVLTKAVLCNWMVTMGTVLAFSSTSSIGRIVAMWLPITVFFAHGYEHAVVNMFVIPAGMALGAPLGAADWWLWNQIPVTIGNIIGGALLTGLPLAWTWGRAAQLGSNVQVTVTASPEPSVAASVEIEASTNREVASLPTTPLQPNA
jgi:formate/nitrite transporter